MQELFDKNKKDDLRILAENVKKYRKKSGLTQAQLAEKVGLKPRAICKIEKGDTFPTHDTLSKLRTILEIPLWYLFDDAEINDLHIDDYISFLQSLDDSQTQSFEEMLNELRKRFK